MSKKKRKDELADRQTDDLVEQKEQPSAVAEEPPKDERDPREAEMDELKLRLAEKTELAHAYFAQLQRVQADFENYQKRIEAERTRIAENACETLIAGLLDTLDNFERAIAHLDGLPDETEKGVIMVYESMLGYLRQNGLERIAATGCQFDPRKHDAIMQAEVPGAADGTVLEEFQAGYAVKGKVVRPTKVKVARAAEKKPCGDAGQANVEIDRTSNDVERKEE